VGWCFGWSEDKPAILPYHLAIARVTLFLKNKAGCGNDATLALFPFYNQLITLL
jgi:hypothetical protein